MKGTFTRSYRSQNGNTVFVYGISGSEEELAQYKTIQGENHRVDDETGAPLWFTTRFAGDSAKMIITQNGNVIADMAEFDKAKSLVEQYGGNLGDALAQSVVGKLLGGQSVASPAPEAQAEEAPAESAEKPLDEV